MISRLASLLSLLAVLIFASTGAHAAGSGAPDDAPHCMACADDDPHPAAMADCDACSICASAVASLPNTSPIAAVWRQADTPEPAAYLSGNAHGFDPPPPRG